MPTNKLGVHYSWKDFFKQWKKGMQQMTPYQQCVGAQFGFIVTAIGIIWGIIFSIMLGYYWMMLILLGGMIVLFFQFVANYQKKMVFKKINDMMEESKEKIE